MYIMIKLPPEFGSFNQIRKENYPFNNLFTSYLAAISRLGLSLNMDVDELVGYIEDRVFDGQRLPDVPKGEEPVNIRYKIVIPEDAGDDHPGAIVKRYIEGSTLTNRMAVMYIARMTLRMSAAYGTSLLRLTRLITDLESVKPAKRQKTEAIKQEIITPKHRVKVESEVITPKVKAQPEEQSKAETEDPSVVTEENTSEPMPRVSKTVTESKPEPETSKEVPVSDPAKAAREALNELAGLVNGGTVVQTNPFLNDFL